MADVANSFFFDNIFSNINRHRIFWIKIFSKKRILGGGMGQELLNRGVKPYGTIWSASAKSFEKINLI